MKRKLDQNEEPSSMPGIGEPSKPEQSEAEPSFNELGLDARLVQAIAKQNFAKPTLVQRKTIPLALDGQDVLAKAECGSGKTAAYLLPVLSTILRRKGVCVLFAAWPPPALTLFKPANELLD
jgi:ATP-dependent RNA helicase DDX56/DBP9